MEVACIMAVRAAEASAQEAATVQESTMALVQNVEDWATLAEREAQERVLKV
jgi:hypothetical protein